MGHFDAIINQAAAALSGQSATSSNGLIEIITTFLANPEIGGISGLVNAFQKQGLGNIVASWVGDGENLPISSTQLLAVFGNDTMQRFAQQIGLPFDEASNTMTTALPQIVNKLSPNGQMPDSDMLSQGLSLLGHLSR